LSKIFSRLALNQASQTADVCQRCALAASRSEQAGQLGEDAQLQEAIRLSKLEARGNSSTPFEDQLRERSARMKRKAEEELQAQSVKRLSSLSLSMNMRSTGPSDLVSLAKAQDTDCEAVWSGTDARKTPAGPSSSGLVEAKL
jgi:tyrosyl-DNA phosphodiesterase 1